MKEADASPAEATTEPTPASLDLVEPTMYAVSDPLPAAGGDHVPEAAQGLAVEPAIEPAASPPPEPETAPPVDEDTPGAFMAILSRADAEAEALPPDEDKSKSS
jgi:hypothetical protein